MSRLGSDYAKCEDEDSEDILFGHFSEFLQHYCNGEPVDPTGQELVAPPIQVLNSSSQLSAVEENSRLAAHGNDRHYTNGIMLTYTTGPFERKLHLECPEPVARRIHVSLSPSKPENRRSTGMDHFGAEYFYSTRSQRHRPESER
jgi:hypothetical protein